MLFLFCFFGGLFCRFLGVIWLPTSKSLGRYLTFKFYASNFIFALIQIQVSFFLAWFNALRYLFTIAFILTFIAFMYSLIMITFTKNKTNRNLWICGVLQFVTGKRHEMFWFSVFGKLPPFKILENVNLFWSAHLSHNEK